MCSGPMNHRGKNQTQSETKAMLTITERRSANERFMTLSPVT
jgi:hypothetical protein